MKITQNVSRWIFILLLPVMLVTATIAVAFNSLWLYRFDFNKYDISAITGISPSELENAARGIINYWNSSDQYIDIVVEKNGQPFTLFNEREVAHMKDVKNLVRLDYAALAFAGVYCLLYAGTALFWRRPRYHRELAVAGFGGGALALAFLGIMGIMATANFDAFWTRFHLLSFANDFWQLDPTRDYLIMMFPEGFWSDAVLMIGLTAAFLALLIGAVSMIFLKRGAKKSPANKSYKSAVI
jgi:integral membrane protein (TIGR01906 family)